MSDMGLPSESFLEQIQIVIEEIEIRLDLLHSADGWREEQHLGPGVRRDFLWELLIEIRLNQKERDLFSLDLLNQVLYMPGRGWDAGLGLDMIDDVQPEALGKVRPGVVVG